MSMTVTANGSASQIADPLVTAYFGAVLDGRSIGSWTEVELGGVAVDVEELEEGGNGAFVYQLPGRIRYDHIKLSRVMDHSTSEVAAWFASMTGAVRRTTGQIVAYDTCNRPALTWKFVDAIPVRWSLPKLGVDSPAVVVESLEIAHHGFVR